MRYDDIYTEAPASADTLANLGPLAPLAGKWYGEDGVDTHPEAEGPVAEPYHEKPVSPQHRGTIKRQVHLRWETTDPQWATSSTNPKPAKST